MIEQRMPRALDERAVPIVVRGQRGLEAADAVASKWPVADHEQRHPVDFQSHSLTEPRDRSRSVDNDVAGLLPLGGPLIREPKAHHQKHDRNTR